MWSSQQKVIKSKLNWTSTSRRFEAGTQSDIARQMKLILQEGIRVSHSHIICFALVSCYLCDQLIQVLYHQRGGYIHRALLRHDTSGGGNRIQLAATEKGCVSSWREVAVGDMHHYHKTIYFIAGCMFVI